MEIDLTVSEPVEKSALFCVLVACQFRSGSSLDRHPGWHKKSKIHGVSPNRVTLKALANVSPGFALGSKMPREIVRNLKGLRGRAVFKGPTQPRLLSGLRLRDMSFPRVAKAQPWAEIGERFQPYLFSDKSLKSG
jgi:hypothetical protein